MRHSNTCLIDGGTYIASVGIPALYKPWLIKPLFTAQTMTDLSWAMFGIYPLVLNNYPGQRLAPVLYPYRATITAFLCKCGTTL